MLEAPYRERLKLARIEREFPPEVLCAVQKPESERTDGEKLLVDQVLSLGVNGGRVVQELTAADRARRLVLVDRIAEVGRQRPARPPMADIVTDGDYRFTPDGPGDEIIGCLECRIPPDEPGSYLHEGPGRYEVPPSHLLQGGDPLNLGPEMSPGFVKVATYGNPPIENSRPDGRTSGRISSYELAYRMQGCAPEAIDTSSESDATKKLYGLDEEITEPFGRQCLMARRLVERGVRFVQLFQGGLGNQNTDTWDAHSDLVENHTQHAAESDLPIAGLLTDLKARGLLDSTLIVWHGEFGRMPISQRGVGRDHNPGAMTAWMAGAGIKGGQVIGATDDFGYKALEPPVSAPDLHATMLHLLGMDHTELTYRFSGRDHRLTGVDGVLIPQIVG